MTGLRSFAPNDADVAASRTVAGPDSTPPRPAGEQTVASRNAVASLTNGTPHRGFESNAVSPCGFSYVVLTRYHWTLIAAPTSCDHDRWLRSVERTPGGDGARLAKEISQATALGSASPQPPLEAPMRAVSLLAVAASLASPLSAHRRANSSVLATCLRINGRQARPGR